MADAVKAVGEDMQQKAANELVGREAHDPDGAPGGDSPCRRRRRRRRRLRRASSWRSRRGECSARDRRAPARGRRTAAWRRRSNPPCAERAMRSAKARGSQSGASSPKKRSSPLSNAASRAARNSRRNERASAFTGRKKPGLQTIQRSPSSETPPPGTTQWTWG